VVQVHAVAKGGQALRVPGQIPANWKAAPLIFGKRFVRVCALEGAIERVGAGFGRGSGCGTVTATRRGD